MIVRWQVDDEYLPGVRCDLSLEQVASGGTNVWPIATNRTVNTAGTGSYTWTLPVGMAVGDNFRIRVTARDTNDHQGVDVSDAYFSIENTSKGGGEDDPPYPCDSPCPQSQGPGPFVTDLLPSAPNPFSNDTRVRFSLEAERDLALKVYDVQGRLVKTLFVGARPKGLYEMVWNGRDDSGSALATGVYFVSMRAGRSSFTKKVVIMR